MTDGGGEVAAGARVVAFVPDLLFGSNVLGALRAGGHDVTLTSAPTPEDVKDADVLVIDLTADVDARIGLARGLARAGLRMLAFYSHVETDVKVAAEDAGIDLVIPRSRMAREGAVLVGRLAA